MAIGRFYIKMHLRCGTERRIIMKRKMMYLASLVCSLALTSNVWAGPLDVYTDYQNADGTYSYYFDLGVTVTLDENWYQNTFVKTGDSGASFYHKASYDAYAAEGVEGGLLFTLGASVNSSFQELPQFVYIGFDEETVMNYYAEIPTDYQAYMGDENIRAQYDTLFAGVEDVIAGIRIGGSSQNIEAGSTDYSSLFTGPEDNSGTDTTVEAGSADDSSSGIRPEDNSGTGSGQDPSSDLSAFLTGGASGGTTGGTTDSTSGGTTGSTTGGTTGSTSGSTTGGTSGATAGSEGIQVTFSDWEEKDYDSEYSKKYQRQISVSDGGNYIFTSRIDNGKRYNFDYDIILFGLGTQTFYTSDIAASSVENGKLFKLESMDECGIDIDQIIDNGSITLMASSSDPFLLVYRQKGGEKDGEVRAVPVVNGQREINTEYFTGMTSAELIAILPFAPEEASALTEGVCVAQPDYTGFVVQQVFSSEEEYGIGLFSYRQAGGSTVNTVQVIHEGFGVFTCYDPADDQDSISVGDFKVLAFNSHYTDARFG